MLIPGSKGLDTGCGAGKITEYLWEKTHANLTGVDTIYFGIRLAKERSASCEGLEFRLADMRDFVKKEKSEYDFILSMDTIYFIGNDSGSFLNDCVEKLLPGGKIFIFYSAWEGKDDSLEFDGNKPGKFLIDNRLEFEFTDFSDDDNNHWKKKKLFLEQNREAFVDEGHEILYAKRYFEASLFESPGTSGKMKRYLYTVFR